MEDGEDGREGDGAKGERFCWLAWRRLVGRLLVLGVNIGRRAVCATVTATCCCFILARGLWKI